MYVCLLNARVSFVQINGLRDWFLACLCVCLLVGTAPFSVVKARLSADIHGGHHGDWAETITDLCFYIFRFFCFNTDRLCLAFTSQRSTGVTTAVASARQSPQVHASQTAVDMKKHSGSVLGKISYSFIHLVYLSCFSLCVCVREREKRDCIHCKNSLTWNGTTFSLN